MSAFGDVHVTIVYLTNRADPKIEWFFDSLHRELVGDYTNVKVVVVDYLAGQPGRGEYISSKARGPIVHVASKPCVWQGPHRLTNRNYFAGANARNTGICLAPDGWIVFVDDLSVILPGWSVGIKDAMSGGYIVFGAYRKVLNLEVKDGIIVNQNEFLPGVDHRIKHGNPTVAVAAPSQWLFGCSFAAPVQALLQVNGLDEDADSTGIAGEDYILGIRLENNGFKFKYDIRMMTHESEELHGLSNVDEFYRRGKGAVGSKTDKGHQIIYKARATQAAGNYFGPGGIAALRQKVLAGEPFPIPTEPSKDWFDGQPLCEL